jgi:predicted RNA binding protein YcfA (HicA-like mRNA interferase family)
VERAAARPARARPTVERLRILSGADVCRVLVMHGFVEVRRRGSHIVMQKRETGGTITVPVPDHYELKKGTLMAIARQSRVPRSEFEEE